jgi:serine/threonine-protein kinase HipA
MTSVPETLASECRKTVSQALTWCLHGGEVGDDDGVVASGFDQEDGCQATATPPGQKYQEQGGPSLRDLATAIRNFGDPHDVAELLRRATFNMAVGNADAHAKNFSLLHGADDPIARLAPLYDVLSTMALETTDSTRGQLHADTHMGQHVGGQADIRKVTSGDLISEGMNWGIRRVAAWTFVR